MANTDKEGANIREGAQIQLELRFFSGARLRRTPVLRPAANHFP